MNYESSYNCNCMKDYSRKTIPYEFYNNYNTSMPFKSKYNMNDICSKYEKNLFNEYNYLSDNLIDESDLALIIINSQYKPSNKKRHFTREDALEIGRKLNIDFNRSLFDVDQFMTGLNVELEHGTKDPNTNVTNDDPILTGKIALAHLNEFRDYYTRLTKLEEEAKRYWSSFNYKQKDYFM